MATITANTAQTTTKLALLELTNSLDQVSKLSRSFKSNLLKRRPKQQATKQTS